MNRSVRLLRLMLPGRNPLARGSDRLAGALSILVLAMGLLLVPVMLTLGTLTYSDLVDRAAQHARDWRQTAAVVTGQIPAAGYVGRGGPVATSSRAMVEWRLPDGTTDSGRVYVEKGTRAGARITIWLDETGKPVTPPARPSDAVAGAVLVAVTGLFAAEGLLTLAYYGAARLLDRRRFRTWEQEWTRVEPEWRNQLR